MPTYGSKGCPVCGRPASLELSSSVHIEREIRLREEFVKERFHYKPDRSELMDLAEFMHGGAGRLMRCAVCGVTVRDEAGAAHYSDDAYERGLMQHLYPRYLNAFRSKRDAYEPLLPHRAEVVEAGSHYGAFLQAAEEWNWRPIGVDIGKDTSSFARSRGLTVRRLPLEDFGLKRNRADAVFFWNCFEQLEDPVSALLSAHKLLKRDGLVIVRVPNIAFYQQQRRLIRRGGPESAAFKRLAYNNLLGFPYRFGYNNHSLTDLMVHYGFVPIVSYASNLITVPFPELRSGVRAEAASARRLRGAGSDRGPWLEMVCRRSG